MEQLKTVRPPRKNAARKITCDEFLKRHTNGEHVEWVNGNVVPMSPVTLHHDDINGFLATIIREYVKMKSLGKVACEPYNMKLGHGFPGRSPDILFVANPNLARMQNKYLDGPADLVVEVVSVESRRRDRVTKFGECERAGVREYWLPDSTRRGAEFFLRDDNGRFQLVTVGDDGIYRSTALQGFWFKLEWLWQTPKPALVEVLRAWGML